MTTTGATSTARSGQPPRVAPSYLRDTTLRGRTRGRLSPLQRALPQAAERKPPVQCEGTYSAVATSAWVLPRLALTAGLDPDEMSRIDHLTATRIRFTKGSALYRYGDGFGALYAIRTGSCKTSVFAPDGLEQVAGYHIVGETIGLDGIGSGVHECQAIALEDMIVHALPFERINDLARSNDQFRFRLLRLLSQESSRLLTLATILATMHAEQRLAIFLLDLSQRYKARGFSASEFVLRLKRQEIGSYLGLTLETVSRLFSRFQLAGLLQVEGRLVRLLDQGKLGRIAGSID